MHRGVVPSPVRSGDITSPLRFPRATQLLHNYLHCQATWRFMEKYWCAIRSVVKCGDLSKGWLLC